MSNDRALAAMGLRRLAIAKLLNEFSVVFVGQLAPLLSSSSSSTMARLHAWVGLVWCLLLSSSFLQVSAQSTATNATSTSSPLPSNHTATPSLTAFPVTTSLTLASVSLSGTQNVTIAIVVPTIYNTTSTISPTATPSSTSTPTPTPITLDTRITPAFSVLGALLILTGLPSAFWGHKNRWYARVLGHWLFG